MSNLQENLEKAKTIINELNGKEWKKGDLHRVYINGKTLCNLYGLEWTEYKTGNVSSASLDGNHISNSQAKELIYEFENANFYYDVKLNRYYGKVSDRHKEILVDCIEERISELI